VSNPNRFLIWMFLFLLLVGAVAFLFYPQLEAAFLANRVFNGMILGVLLIGVLINFRQVGGLKPDVRWIDAITDGLKEQEETPRLLMSFAKMLAGRGKQRTLRMSALTMRSLLDGIRTRLDESRDISHYLIGLLIFLGLLGTFWGLLDTIAGVADVIGGLAGAVDTDPGAAFTSLTRKLEGPLSGMGTAFSSSLFGLSGALVVGFLDLQAGHAQNRFFNELEDWLSELAHISSGPIGIESETTLPAYVEGLLEQTAESLNQLQRTLTRAEEARIGDYAQQAELTNKLGDLNDLLRSEQKTLLGMGKSLAELQPLLSRLLGRTDEHGAEVEEMRDHLRNIDVGIARLGSDLATGRTQVVDELRQELRLLNHTLGHRIDSGR